MAADPQVVEAGKTVASTMARILVPALLIMGAVAIALTYFFTKLDKKVDNFISQRKAKKQATQATESCPRCGGNLVVRSGRFGDFIGCSNYPKCKFTKKI